MVSTIPGYLMLKSCGLLRKGFEPQTEPKLKVSILLERMCLLSLYYNICQWLDNFVLSLD